MTMKEFDKLNPEDFDALKEDLLKNYDDQVELDEVNAEIDDINKNLDELNESVEEAIEAYNNSSDINEKADLLDELKDLRIKKSDLLSDLAEQVERKKELEKNLGIKNKKSRKFKLNIKKGAIARTTKKAAAGMRTVFGKVGGFFKTAGTKIVDVTKAAGRGIKKAGRATIDFAKPKLSVAGNKIAEVSRGAVRGIRGAFSRVKNFCVTKAENLVERHRIKKAAKQEYKSTLDALKGEQAAINEAAAEELNQAKNIDASIIEDIENKRRQAELEAEKKRLEKLKETEEQMRIAKEAYKSAKKGLA